MIENNFSFRYKLYFLRMLTVTDENDQSALNKRKQANQADSASKSSKQFFINKS